MIANPIATYSNSVAVASSLNARSIRYVGVSRRLLRNNDDMMIDDDA